MKTEVAGYLEDAEHGLNGECDSRTPEWRVLDSLYRAMVLIAARQDDLAELLESKNSRD